MNDELKPLPEPPNVPEEIEQYIHGMHLSGHPEHWRIGDIFQAAVYEHFWREEQPNRNGDGIGFTNAELCASRCRELSK